MEVLLNKLFDKHSEGYGVYDRENLIKDIFKELQNLQLQQISVSISVDRVQKYAKHQFNRGALGYDFVEFKEWQH